MIRLIYISFLVLILNGCLGNKAPITCVQLSNDYYKYNNTEKEIILDVAKGYQELAKYIFVYDNTSQFNIDIDTYFLYLELFKKKSIDKPFVNDYCHSINLALKDENMSKVSSRLNKIKEKWTNDYNINIENNLKNKIKFNEIDGCKEYASILVEYILTYRIINRKDEIYLELLNNYNNCLDLHKNKDKK